MSDAGAWLRELITAEGPITVERYMALALGHPVHGYYVTRDPLGRDFTTAPEISQMFGELLGAWSAAVWDMTGRPDPVRWVELGPGRGTLMADAWRAARRMPGFSEAVRIELVETSPVLRDRQRDTLRSCEAPVAWRETLSEVPGGPLIALGNEFLDALPVRQFVRVGDGWRERLVGLDTAGALAFGMAAGPEPRLRADAPAGAVLEVGEAGLRLVGELASRIAREGGAALLIDYGHAETAWGETLQAVRAGRTAPPLAAPGEQDLTAHVDFAAVLQAGARAGAVAHGPVEQGAFLRALGIEARAARLKAHAVMAEAAAIEAALARLTEGGPTGMGRLFKAVALTSAGLSALPGFPPPTVAVRTAEPDRIAC